MLRERGKLIIGANYALEMAIVWGAFWVAYQAYAPTHQPPFPPYAKYRSLLLLSLLSWSIVLWFTPSYFSARVRSIRWALGKTVQAGLFSALLLFAGTAVFKLQYASRGLELMAIAIGTAALAGERVAVRLGMRWARTRGHNYRQVVIVGTGGAARRVARMIEGHPEWGLRILGLFADGDDARPRTVGGRPVLGGVRDLPDYMRSSVVDEVIFCVPRQRRDTLTDLFLKCDELGIKTRVMMNFLPRSAARVTLEDLDGIPMLTYSRTPTSELELVAKRAIDLAASAALLVVLSPVLAAVGLAIRLESRGPVLFRQRRVGLYGRVFTLYKFRSMTVDAEARQLTLAAMNEMDGPVFKIRRDPRVTAVGRVIRRLSLDELPQLLNVLRGEMSLVGPRPLPVGEVDRMQSWQRRRLSMKPGITCLWQVSGRNTVNFQRWMRLDLEYIDNWSLWLDTKILLRTVPAVLETRGAW